MKSTTLLEQLTAQLVGDIAVLQGQVQDLQSSLPAVFHQSAMQAAYSLEHNLRQVTQDIEEAVQRERQFATVILNFESEAKKRLEHHATSVFGRELERTKRAMEGVACAVLTELRQEVDRASPSIWRMRFYVGMLAAVIFSFISGLVIASTRDLKMLVLTPQEMRQLDYGRQVESILPKLSKESVQSILKDTKK